MLLILSLACSTRAPDAAPPLAASPEAVAPPASSSAPGTTFGAPVDLAGAVPADQVVAAAETWSGKPVTLRGVVQEVCQKKGCWFTIATADPAVNVMVKDKEYKIFLPFDSAGKTVAVNGTFSVGTMPLEEARHYAEDAGRDPAAITEAPKTFQVDADGIVFL